MGANTSRAADSGEEVTGKPLRSRSSLNLLKRTRTPSCSTRPNPGPTRASCPPPTIVTIDTENGFVGKAESLEIGSPSSQSNPFQSVDTPDEDRSSIASVSTSSTATPAATSEGAGEDKIDDDSSNSSRHRTPVPSSTRVISLPTTFVLPEDSPTKYGLRTASTPSPDAALSQAQRKNMTAGALFQHAVERLKEHQNAHALDRISRSSSSRSSSSLPMRGTSQRALLSTTNRPPHQVSRRGVFKQEPRAHVAHGLALRPSQLGCYRRHDAWHSVAKQGHHSRHPVACGICDGYEAPGDGFKRCNWCWVIACGECQDTFARTGMSGMMERQKTRVES